MLMGCLNNSIHSDLQQLLRANKKGHVESCVINPKCCQLGDLYGESDPNTFEWSDGLIASTVRRFAKELTADNKADSNKASKGAAGGGRQVASEVSVCHNLLLSFQCILRYFQLVKSLFQKLFKNNCIICDFFLIRNFYDL